MNTTKNVLVKKEEWEFLKINSKSTLKDVSVIFKEIWGDKLKELIPEGTKIFSKEYEEYIKFKDKFKDILDNEE